MSETVTITRAEYDRLRAAEEDFADLRAALAVRERTAPGTEELVPAAVADRLIDGESPLKVWRGHRALSQSALARALGREPRSNREHRGRPRHRLRPDPARPRRHTLRVTIDDLLPA